MDAPENQMLKRNRWPVLLSVPATFLWLGVGMFLLKWARAWATGRTEPGIGTTWTALYLMFALAALACAGGLCLAIMAWMGKSSIRWQAFSIVLGLVLLWLVSGD